MNLTLPEDIAALLWSSTDDILEEIQLHFRVVDGYGYLNLEDFGGLLALLAMPANAGAGRQLDFAVAHEGRFATKYAARGHGHQPNGTDGRLEPWQPAGF